MDRETILKKAQNETDEMVAQTRDKSMKYTYIALVLCAAFFSFIRGLKNQPVMDLSATVCFSVFANRIYFFIKHKEKSDLIIAAIAMVIAVMATIGFFMGH